VVATTDKLARSEQDMIERKHQKPELIPLSEDGSCIAAAYVEGWLAKRAKGLLPVERHILVTPWGSYEREFVRCSTKIGSVLAATVTGTIYDANTGLSMTSPLYVKL
jgi:hypothetical protein